jgi:hypothetical protein
LKRGWWGSQLIQEQTYQGGKECDKRHTVIIITTVTTTTTTTIIVIIIIIIIIHVKTKQLQ